MPEKAYPSPKPWRVHRTGSHLGIKAANGKFVIRKVVNSLSIEQYGQLEADFEYIVRCINQNTDTPPAKV